MKNQSILRIRSIGILFGCLFTLMPAAGQITGQWEFNGDLKASTGGSGSYWSFVRDVAIETQFGTTASFGIADIGGQAAKVMKFPRNDPKMGYAMFPEIAANGGGAYVNQYTLIMDLLYPASSGGVYRGLLQTNDCNTNEGDLFLNPDGAIGINGEYSGQLAPDTWHRVALAFDLAAVDGPTVTKYVDGAQVGIQTLSEGVDGRWSLWTNDTDQGFPTLLFTDDNDETAPGYVNSVQIRNYTMSNAEVAALGGASAAGITLPPNPSTAGVTGQWDFDAGDLSATTGPARLEYFKGCPPRECTQDLLAATQFGKATSLGAPRINGLDPVVMSFPLVEPCGGYLFPDGILPNGGGIYVNKYSIIMDVYYPTLDPSGWAALYQANLSNTDDSEVYINDTGGVGILGQYGGPGVVDGAWHRIGISVDLNNTDATTSQLNTYVDGQLATTVTNLPFDDRFSLGSSILLFTEAAFYTSAGYVNSLQIRDYPMTADEMAALSGPTAAGIGLLDPRPAPDADRNGFVDQADLVLLMACTTGPMMPLAPTRLLECERFDVDHDGDVDQADFGIFQEFYTGTRPCGGDCYYP